MAGIIGGQRVVRGDAGRKLNNALTLTFTTGGEEPVATAVQARRSGVVGKMGVLFGFKNGGSGLHELVAADGSKLLVESRAWQSTLVRDGHDQLIGEVQRRPDAISGRTDTDRWREAKLDTSRVHLPDDTTLFTVAADPEHESDLDAFRLVLVEPSGARLATLAIIRSAAGWSLAQDVMDDIIWFGKAGQSLPIFILGSLLVFDRDPTPIEGDLALAMCVDICIGHSPYIPAMD